MAAGRSATGAVEIQVKEELVRGAEADPRHHHRAAGDGDIVEVGLVGEVGGGGPGELGVVAQLHARNADEREAGHVERAAGVRRVQVLHVERVRVVEARVRVVRDVRAAVVGERGVHRPVVATLARIREVTERAHAREESLRLLVGPRERRLRRRGGAVDADRTFGRDDETLGTVVEHRHLGVVRVEPRHQRVEDVVLDGARIAEVDALADGDDVGHVERLGEIVELRRAEPPRERGFARPHFGDTAVEPGDVGEHERVVVGAVGRDERDAVAGVPIEVEGARGHVVEVGLLAANLGERALRGPQEGVDLEQAVGAGLVARGVEESASFCA